MGVCALDSWKSLVQGVGLGWWETDIRRNSLPLGDTSLPLLRGWVFERHKECLPCMLTLGLSASRECFQILSALTWNAEDEWRLEFGLLDPIAWSWNCGQVKITFHPLFCNMGVVMRSLGLLWECSEKHVEKGSLLINTSLWGSWGHISHSQVSMS